MRSVKSKGGPKWVDYFGLVVYKSRKLRKRRPCPEFAALKLPTPHATFFPFAKKRNVSFKRAKRNIRLYLLIKYPDLRSKDFKFYLGWGDFAVEECTLPGQIYYVSKNRVVLGRRKKKE